MNTLSFEELQTMSELVVETDLLEQVSGGTSNDCHCPGCPPVGKIG